jgi:DNA-binding response OmpR family regulator
LIILCSGTQTPREAAAIVAEIRTYNVAPLLLLTDQDAIEWSLITLPAGADVALPIHMPEEVILARCIALLRRWLPAA